MNGPPDNPNGIRQLESVHVCPRCGHILNLDQIDLRAITTGIVACPKCDWEGSIEIQVIDVDDD